ncbi:MAG: tetratricopeptide repeat protein [Pseudorhodoplanes sp.]|jgi:tetratricopeptide (TPR) repeat protein|nr:tetratricopeptide repeat protein [Pseudorhodoplanes sp.]
MTAFRFIIISAALTGAAVFVSGNAGAVDTREPSPTFRTQSGNPPPKTEQTKKPKKKTPAKKETDKDKKSEQRFLDGYRHAHDLIYRDKDYAAGIEALRALKRDEHPDVANLLGFSSRKLGRYDDARLWYEKALAADPNHTRTWQYYGMWQLEQGNRLKAEEYLGRIAAICGTGCDDYKSLKLALAGGVNY